MRGLMGKNIYMKMGWDGIVHFYDGSVCTNLEKEKGKEEEEEVGFARRERNAWKKLFGDWNGMG